MSIEIKISKRPISYKIAMKFLLKRVEKVKENKFSRKVDENRFIGKVTQMHVQRFSGKVQYNSPTGSAEKMRKTTSEKFRKSSAVQRKR